jgi:hypothetical protein
MVYVSFQHNRKRIPCLRELVHLIKVDHTLKTRQYTPEYLATLHIHKTPGKHAAYPFTLHQRAVKAAMTFRIDFSVWLSRRQPVSECKQTQPQQLHLAFPPSLSQQSQQRALQLDPLVLGFNQLSINPPIQQPTMPVTTRAAAARSEAMTPTPTYTFTVLKALEYIMGSVSFAQYTNIALRVLHGKISGAASLPALGYLFSAQPRGTILHNELVAMTHDILLIFNLPEFYDKPDAGDVEQMKDMVRRFAESEGRRPSDAREGREVVVQCLGEMCQAQAKSGEQVDDLVAGMGAMVF